MSPDHQETEVKFYVRHLDALADRILAAGGRLRSARVHELNLRFDTLAGDLRRLGRALRLRRDAAIRLTYKDSGVVDRGALSRREIEFGVDDFDAAQQLLQALGYETVFTYEKWRTTYDMGPALMMLDELPFGNFLEIEGAREALQPLASQLNLDWAAAIPLSYHALFDYMRLARSLPFHDLTFANLAGSTIQPADLGVRPADE